MHFCVRHLKAKKNPAVFIQRQTNNKQAWYTWKSITYTSSLKNQNKWGGWICTKGMNSKETISLIHPKRCVPFTANSSPRIGTVFLFPVFLDYFLPLSCREELGGQLAASKGQPTTKAPLCDRWDWGALCKPRPGWSSGFCSFHCRVPTYPDPAVSDTAF